MCNKVEVFFQKCFIYFPDTTVYCNFCIFWSILLFVGPLPPLNYMYDYWHLQNIYGCSGTIENKLVLWLALACFFFSERLPPMEDKIIMVQLEWMWRGLLKQIMTRYSYSLDIWRKKKLCLKNSWSLRKQKSYVKMFLFSCKGNVWALKFVLSSIFT